MKIFKDLEFKPHTAGMGGVMSRIIFENGYGASVVSTSFSYGGKKGLYELAVLDDKGELCYETPVTDDVKGWLNEGEVTELLKQIQEL